VSASKQTEAPAQPVPEPRYDALLRLDHEALAAAQCEIAYHALTAALHCAEAARELGRIERVAALAEEHRRTIDAEDPQHRLGSAAAAGRGHHGVFEMLTGQAAAVLVRLRGAKAVERAPHRPWPDRLAEAGEERME
jgi:hypothetical protein